MLVFRDGSSVMSSTTVLRELDALLEAEPLDLLPLLFWSADVESALEDARHVSAPLARELTDAFAEAWLGVDPAGVVRARGLLSRLALPPELRIKRPEGYAFYALDPAAYARLAPACAPAGVEVRVVGVRTIGTSLSAIVRASVLRAGRGARRITVRPSGHPWARRLVTGASERRFVEEAPPRAEFLVVDEGPGRSGSTFLAVGEALERLGVSSERIRFISSHAIDPTRLVAEHARDRFARYRSDCVAPWSVPAGALDLSGGAWRRHARVGEWPACWSPHERVKYLDAERKTLHKFSGFAQYGAAVHERARLLAEEGFGPAVASSEPGFLAYEWLRGPSLQARIDRQRALEPMATYLAFRTRAFVAPQARQRELEAMAALNVYEAIGERLPQSFELALRQPVVPDGRMLPHEWVLAKDGGFVKTDGAEHGDDHFFPGPTDVAWDLAGAVVEWDLHRDEEEAFVRAYAHAAGDDVRERMGPYKIAYSAFRLGVVAFAANDADEDDQRRWHDASTMYRRRLRRELVLARY